MQHVAIVGAGELGGAIAHILARRDAVRRITLIDDAGSVAAGKALDLAQAAPVEGFATSLAGTTDLSYAAGAELVVVADRAAGQEWQGEDGLQLLKRVRQTAASAAIVCAGAMQRDLIDRGVRELKIGRTRLFGTAPEALAGGARALTALAAHASPRDIALSVLGVPPGHTVIAWQDATLAGLSLTRLLDEPTRRRIGARVAALWPPGPHALAAAAWAAIDAMTGRSRRRASCFVAPDDRAGIRARTAAMPVTLGPSGIVDVLSPTLSVVERVALENAMLI